MNLFKRHKTLNLYAPVSGHLKPITDVADPVFSQRAVGDGFAVEPTTSDIYSPIEGTVTSIFPTKHALTLKAKSGQEVLLHMGLDTVELNGEGFTILVTPGEKIDQSTQLATLDLASIKAHDKITDILTVISDTDVKLPDITAADVKQGDVIVSQPL
ncbi:PTS sugar transporter subunit IIA [Lacticaseibacillus saniviri]|uniref:Sugar-specific permease EIIA n=1 Tax=Lacticaseibacillus saniviri JCM 17471 = DSM 24301 TaxID=1293598 RepID=A0A0R2N4C0_9LACO|nr:PTS glucose transporter subunit IIA [Lacticaseibacillus saniviri]KRO18925.1 sugar-specific permease EIIA [Lacticaseibacillus saniviri JCM 17471 = DSM 24301]MCG4280943.1 PTS glucose transporter subunit IIA [Lacticaseibacillus saniviri]